MSKTTVCNGTKIIRFTGEVFDAVSYVIVEDNDALIFDAADSNKMISYLNSSNIKNITLFLTHEHFDHIFMADKLRNMFNCNVISSSECSSRMQSSKGNLSSIADVLISMNTHSEVSGMVTGFSVSAADETFDGKCTFEWHKHIIECHCLGGHSAGSACYVLDESILFSGDDLLPIPVITRFPGGSTKKFRNEDIPLFESLKNNISLVFPAHGQPGNPEDMLKINITPDKFRQ